MHEDILSTLGTRRSSAATLSSVRRIGGRQGRIVQSRRIGQGPHRPRSDPSRRARRQAEAGRHDRRADVGEHGAGARDGGGAPRLQADLHRPRQDLEGEDVAPPRVRREGDHLSDQRRSGRPALVLQGRRADPRRRGGLPSLSVLQPGEPGGALRHHRSRDLEADGREGHALGGRRRNRRHDRRDREVPEGAKPGRARDRRRHGRQRVRLLQSPREAPPPIRSTST